MAETEIFHTCTLRRTCRTRSTCGENCKLHEISNYGRKYWLCF